jgi:hypothetical protein
VLPYTEVLVSKQILQRISLPVTAPSVSRYRRARSWHLNRKFLREFGVKKPGLSQDVGKAGGLTV